MRVAAAHLSVGATASARGRRGLVPGAPLHKRISLLEVQLEDLEDELDRQRQELQAEIERSRKSVLDLLSAQAGELQSVASKLEEVAVGGSTLQLVGWTWLVLGVICATFPQELAGLFGWLV
jgi:phosphoglycerate-specific signal transduction histidine kinase